MWTSTGFPWCNWLVTIELRNSDFLIVIRRHVCEVSQSFSSYLSFLLHFLHYFKFKYWSELLVNFKVQIREYLLKRVQLFCRRWAPRGRICTGQSNHWHQEFDWWSKSIHRVLRAILNFFTNRLFYGERRFVSDPRIFITHDCNQLDHDVRLEYLVLHRG